MGKKSQYEMSLHEKALRLIEGGIVACNDLPVRVIDVVGEDNSCYYCEMGSACHDEMVHLCLECDLITHTRHYLELVCG